MKMIEKPQVVLVPYPAQGHVTPILHLARALYAHGFRPVIALPDFIYRRISAKTNTGDDDCMAFLSVPTGLGDGDKDFFAIDRVMENCMPAHFEIVLKGLQSEGEVACVVVDLLASWAIGVAVRCGILTGGFWPAMFATYRIVSAIPELTRRGLISDSGAPLYQHLIEEEEEEVSKLMLLPTKSKLSTKDLPWLVGNPASQKLRFKFWLRTMDRANDLPWLLVNSFPQEEGQHDETLGNGCPRIFQIGPLVASNNSPNRNPNPTMWEEDKSCLNWLQLQSPNSVIYISFGSWVGPIGHEKVTELALGLKATRRPFLWVLKDDAAWRNGLPNGFLDWVAGRGKVVSWVPQEAVLAHEAVGCYVTHCGWNSTVEGIRYGKRLVCYPISGDQFVNCNFIVRVWGIGIKPEGFGRREIEDSVQRVMEGKEGKGIQERMLGLRQKVMGAKGSSTVRANLLQFVNAIRKAQ